MTNEQKNRCHAIIHSAAVAAGGGNALPIPALGLAADTAALASMAIGLAAVFGQNIGEAAARAASIDVLKKTLLKQPVKVISKEVAKFIPGFGSVFAASVSVGLVEAAGWSLAGEYEWRSRCGIAC